MSIRLDIRISIEMDDMTRGLYLLPVCLYAKTSSRVRRKEDNLLRPTPVLPNVFTNGLYHFPSTFRAL